MDAYDKAIAWLKSLKPSEIKETLEWCWMLGIYCKNPENRKRYPAYILFGSLGSSRQANYHESMACGCLTQVKSSLLRGSKIHQLPSTLRHEIANDPLVPPYSSGLNLETLERFGYYHRKVDALLGRPAPFWEGPEIEAESVV